MTIGEVINRVERCTSPRGFFLLVLVRDAVMELDVSALEQVIKRVDGIAPEEGELDIYANLIGDALEDVLDYEDIRDVFSWDPEVPVAIAIAKALYIIAVKPCGPNTQARKDKAKAMDIIFQRTGGRKVKPVRSQLEDRFVDPDWMTLPEGEQ